MRGMGVKRGGAYSKTLIRLMAKFEAYTKDATTPDKGLAKRYEMFPMLDIKHKPKIFYRSFLISNV